MERLKNDPNSGPSIDHDGNLTVEVLGWVRFEEGVRMRVRLPGATSLFHFADVKNGLFGDESVFVFKGEGRREKSFFSDLDRPDIGAPLFAFSKSVPPEDVVYLFAAMLRYPRREDMELLKELHPAHRTLLPRTSDGEEGNVASYDPNIHDHVETKRYVELDLAQDWAFRDGVLLGRTQEPYYTVLAPDKTDGNIVVTCCVGDHYLNAPFATFSADRKKDVDRFADMLVELGSGVRAAADCEIVLRAPEYVTPRNHGTEIANMSWAIAEGGYGWEREKGFDDFNEAAEGAGGFFPHWSSGGYWVDPYGTRDERDDWQERWSARWRSVSAKIGPVSIERLQGCSSDKVRARMRMKPILDYLTWGGEFWSAGTRNEL
jgi:hypothetical protein